MSHRLLLIPVAALAVVPSAAPAAAMQVPPAAAAQPQVVTSASGEARLAPDRANILIGVQTRAATAAAAARDNNARQQAVIAAIGSAGIPREQISTENYNLFAETRSDRAGQNPVVAGYVASNVVRVEVRRTDQVGPVIDAALAKGANQINGLEFFSSNTDAGRRQALAEAIGKARGDAEAMARAAGGHLGQLLELSTEDSGPVPIYRSRQLDKASAMATPIEPGELTLRVGVTARWQFVPDS
ncbi:MAG: SIMPL domain-containing protein [Myxococcales bacterium]